MTISLFLCGDVMTGRGIDQALPFPVSPRIYEPYIQDSREYLQLAMHKNGPIKFPCSFSYVWGEALKALEKYSPDFRLINLETSVTLSDDFWKGKEINYRMNPSNIPCLIAAQIDCCALANNHVLDWGYEGLHDTIKALDFASIYHCGAGCDMERAVRPAILHKNNTRVLVYAFGSVSAGVPFQWKATQKKPGVAFINEDNSEYSEWISQLIRGEKKEGDIVVVSIHWGDNWGYEIPEHQIHFAHDLVDNGGADVLWCHSSHHVKNFEMYHHKLILYGCGDFINDYEGIEGFEQYRPDLVLMYFPILGQDGVLENLIMVPLHVKNFTLNKVHSEDIDFLKNIFNNKNSIFTTKVYSEGDILKVVCDT